MSRQRATPTNSERPFGIDELFFSTTDAKGIIQSGNSVFARVSGAGSVQSLIGEPHNIVRHPDMPRTAFALLWKHALSGKPVACYVKNMAMDGGFYWVMALIVPAPNGFLSVRFKPSSKHFHAVKALYAEMVAVEREHSANNDDRKRGMDLSRGILDQFLNRNGYEDYDAFMQTALPEEYAGRDALMGDDDHHISGRDGLPGGGPTQGHLMTALGRSSRISLELRGFFSVVNSFLTLNDKLRSESAYLLGMARSINLLSLNALVQCNRLGNAGQALAVIADRMAKLAAESTVTISVTAEAIRSVVGTLREAAFSITSARLQVDMAVSFVEELRTLKAGATDEGDSVSDARTETDITTLIATSSTGTRRMLDALPEANHTVSSLHSQAGRLSNSLRMLGQVQIAGKVEAARADQTSQFAALFERVRHQVNDAQEELNGFLDSTGFLASDIARIEQPSKLIRHEIDLLEASTQI
jgi:aerotaxis receptor